MNKSMSMMKKMGSLLIEESIPIKLEELHLVLIKKNIEIKDRVNMEAQEQYELYNSLNPRYFEVEIRPKDSQLKLDAMFPRSNQSLIRPY